MDLQQLIQLVTIADLKTLSKAAEELLISQPALTRSIQRLEEELDVQLFDRKKNKITLNDNGKLAVEYARRILDESNNMINQLRIYDRSKRMINIGSCAPAPIWGLEYIFHQLYPDIKATSHLDSNETLLLEGLENHEYSIIVINHPLENENYECLKLFDENLYLTVPPAHPLAMCKEISFSDLNGESILLLSTIGFWNEICLKMLPDSHLLFQDNHDIFDELANVSALPNFSSNITMISHINKRNRVFIPITDKEAYASYYVIFSKKDRKIFNPIKDLVNQIDWKKIAI